MRTLFSLTLASLLAACDGGSPAPPSDSPATNPSATSAEISQPAAPSETADAADAGMSPAQPGLLTEAQFAALHQLKADAAPALQGATVTLPGGASAYLSLPEGAAPHPAVLVIHEWWGLNEHIKHYADRLAAVGYAALAVDLYGGTVASTPDEAMAAMKAVDSDAARATLKEAHAFLEEDERIQADKTGAIGWCFGGGWSLQTAMMVEDLDAAVVYYGRIPEGEPASKLNAPVLAHFGRQDGGIPVASVEAFAQAAKEAGKDVEVHLYDADHAFANPSSDRYAAGPAKEAWDRTEAFLKAKLGE